MNRSTSVFGAIAIVTGITAVVLWQQLHDERTVKAQSQRMTQAPFVPKGAEQQLPVAQTSAPAEITYDAQASANVVPVVDGATAAAIARAENAPRIRLSGRMESYPDLAKELGLTPEEAEAFAALLDQQQIDLLMRYPPDSAAALAPEALRAREELERKQKAELEARLGPRYPQWEEYQSTVVARRGVNEIRTMLPADSPLTDYQSTALLATLVAETKRQTEDARLRIPPAVDPRSQLEFQEQEFRDGEASYRRVIESARSYLSAEQLAGMENTIAQYSTKAQAAFQSRRERLESGGG